jgi:hypothetical protein
MVTEEAATCIVASSVTGVRRTYFAVDGKGAI